MTHKQGEGQAPLKAMTTCRTTGTGNRAARLRRGFAGLAAFGAVFAAGEAAAQPSFNAGNIVANLVGSSAGLTDLMSLLAYVGGTAFAIAGIFKLKVHVDAPDRVPLREGMIRLVAGGMLLSLPFMTAVMQGSVSNGDVTQAPPAVMVAFETAALPTCDPSAFTFNGVATCDAYFPGGWSPP